MNAIQFAQENSVVLLGLALALSEALSLIPSIKANGLFQLIFGWLKKSKKP